MHIVVNEELKAYIEPLTPDEHDALERSILAEGCRDALVLWGDVLVDGHNRYGICQKHGLPFQTVQNPRFQSLEDVHLWMIDQHLGRRSVSDFQRGVLALRKREIIAARKAQAPEATDAEPTALPAPQPLNSREAIAKAARLSSSQVVMIEKIQKQAAPELVAAVAAGRDELKQAAKRVRDQKRKPKDKAPVQDSPAPLDADAEAGADELQVLRHRVAELTAENTELRRQLARLQADLPADSPAF